jgi:hypothetical protein
MNRTHLAIGALGVGAVILLWAAKSSSASDSLANVAPWRRAMVLCARDKATKRVPYQWGGGHEHAMADFGVDCSGLIIRCGQETGMVNASGWGSQRMMAELPRTQAPQPGDVALYSPRHVVMVESFDPRTGIATIIGANGGDSSTTTPEIAAMQNAFVRREPTHLYRPRDFMWFANLESLAVAGKA